MRPSVTTAVGRVTGKLSWNPDLISHQTLTVDPKSHPALLQDAAPVTSTAVCRTKALTGAATEPLVYGRVRRIPKVRKRPLHRIQLGRLHFTRADRRRPMPAESNSAESTEPPSSSSDPPSSPPMPFRTAWPWVLCVIGLDYLSTLAYQPSVAFGAAGRLAPLVTVFVAAVTLFVALPVYSTSRAGRRTAAVRPRSWSASSPAGSANCSCSRCSRSVRWTSCSRGRSPRRPRPNTSRATPSRSGSRLSTRSHRAARHSGDSSRTGCANSPTACGTGKRS